MEAKLFRVLYHRVHAIAHPGRGKREQFSDHWIVIVHLWSVIHHQPRYWACTEQNWPAEMHRPLPSPSRLSRRMRTLGVQQLLGRALTAAAELFPTPLVKQIDSKPLVVGAYSKDRDAKRGRLANGQFARGYRLHVLNHGRITRDWTLMPMNEHDSTAAPVLLSRLSGYGYVTADNAYDTNTCYQLAAAAGHQLVAPPRECNKGVRDARYNCPQRLRGLDIIDSPLSVCGISDTFGTRLYGLRQRVESGFGGLSFAGLGPLPPWVRRPHRVACFVAAKLLLFLWRTAEKQGLMRMTQ